MSPRGRSSSKKQDQIADTHQDRARQGTPPMNAQQIQLKKHEDTPKEATSVAKNGCNNTQLNTENSEKVDKRKRGFKQSQKKVLQQIPDQQQVVQQISTEKDYSIEKRQEGSQMVTQQQQKPEDKEVLSTCSKMNSNPTRKNYHQQHLDQSCSIQNQQPSKTQQERSSSIDLTKKIWNRCKFDANNNRCRNSSDECKFVHLDKIHEAALSDRKKLVKLSIDYWDEAKLDEKYYPGSRSLLNEWANSNSSDRNPLLVQLNKIMEEEDPDFAQTTDELKVEEEELEKLQEIVNIKKSHWMEELSKRLRNGILKKSRMKAFEKLLEDSAIKKRTEQDEYYQQYQSNATQFSPYTQSIRQNEDNRGDFYKHQSYYHSQAADPQQRYPPISPPLYQRPSQMIATYQSQPQQHTSWNGYQSFNHQYHPYQPQYQQNQDKQYNSANVKRSYY